MKAQSPRRKPAVLSLQPVHRSSIRDNIVDQIMALIEKGDLRPGQRLPSERDLCTRFGTGRSSLREALRCLSIIGILNARIGDGTSVATDGAKFLGRILQWRMLTERHDMENLIQAGCAGRFGRCGRSFARKRRGNRQAGSFPSPDEASLAR